jgi:molybdenum cofactor biosynthesis enzyme MoaA
MSNITIEKQEIVQGSSHIVNSNLDKKFDKIEYMKKNMEYNLAYTYYIQRLKTKDLDKKILKNFINRYVKYRYDWLNSPHSQYLKKSEFISGKGDLPNPLCVDIETASICDLGCPHCFRDYIITPDKIMNRDLYEKIISSVVKMDVPSIKLNWRGEPLLNPKICDFIDHAKKNSVLETMINTNATQLTEKMSKNLILAGLDQIIFSFDGGTKKTYDKMRPGRFKENTFEDVYKNIKNFSKIRNDMGMKFPTTKIQMVLTEDTRDEIEDFHNLFNEFVDDVTVIHYHERGGNMSKISPKIKEKINSYTQKNNLPEDIPYMVTADNQIYLSSERKPCPQIFQRLMVTYDGRVGMCCHDWGAQHCIGVIDKRSINNDAIIQDLETSIKKNKKGFELLKNAKKPENYTKLTAKPQKLEEIWDGDELNKVRTIQAKKEANNLEVCRRCVSTDTYEWFKI